MFRATPSIVSTVSSFVVKRRQTMHHVSASPLFIPDGRISRVQLAILIILTFPLWSTPWPALALSFLWVLHLNFSLIIGTTGSHVPHKSLNQVRATFMPDAAQAVSRSPLDLSWSMVSPPVLTSSIHFDTSEVVRLRSSP